MRDQCALLCHGAQIAQQVGQVRAVLRDLGDGSPTPQAAPRFRNYLAVLSRAPARRSFGASSLSGVGDLWTAARCECGVVFGEVCWGASTQMRMQHLESGLHTRGSATEMSSGLILRASVFRNQEGFRATTVLGGGGGSGSVSAAIIPVSDGVGGTESMS